MDKRDLPVSMVVFILMLVPRMVFLPYTSGSDIPQFAGFADTFLRHGFCFYDYADASHSLTEGWPYSWPYNYGPGLILLLSPLRKLFPSPVIQTWDLGGVYQVFAPVDWIVVSKSLFVTFDVLSTVIIYLIVRKHGYSRKASALLTSLYAFNPATIYVSSIYGMFDQIPLFLFLLGIYLLYLRNGSMKTRLTGSLIIGLTITFKQTFLFPVLIVLYDLLLRSSERRVKLILSMTVILGGLLLFIPFFAACPNSLASLKEILLASGHLSYTYPIPYSYNGISSLASYIYEHTGKDVFALIYYWWVPMLLLLSLTLMAYYWNRDPILSSALVYILSIATYWRVNYQYLVPAIAFAILLPLRLKGNNRLTILSIIFILTVGFWTVMFPVSWWTHAHIMNPNRFIWGLLDKLSLRIFDEEPFLIYSLFLTLIEYLLVLEVLITTISKSYRLLGKQDLKVIA